MLLHQINLNGHAHNLSIKYTTDKIFSSLSILRELFPMIDSKRMDAVVMK